MIFHQPEWIEACFNICQNEWCICFISKNDDLVCVLVFSSTKSSSSVFLFPTKVLSLEPQISTIRPPALIGVIDKNHHNIPLQEAIEKAIDSIKWNVGFFQ